MLKKINSTFLGKVIQIGGITIISRILGIIREVLIAQYLGAGIISDAFLIALKIPSSFRKIFAEGALSAAFVPSFIATLKKSKKEAESMLSLAFILFEGGLLLLCIVVMIWAPFFAMLIAPGFSAQQIAVTVPLLRIVMPFIFFISSSALLAGALQSVDHFFVPAFGPVLLNIVFIAGLLWCKWYNLSITVLCFFVVSGAVLQFIQHLLAYYKQGFSFGPISWSTWYSFVPTLIQFGLCALSMSTSHLSMFIDSNFSSYLSAGTTSLLSYAHKFMTIPLGVFGVAFSTILLPYFSRLEKDARYRFNFYVLESAKLMLWVTVPATFGLIFFSHDIFATLFSHSLTPAQIQEAGRILQAFSLGLFFFSYNKILLSVFYSFHAPIVPALISAFSLLINIGLNALVLSSFNGVGLAFATSVTGIVQTVLLAYFLYARFAIHGHLKRFLTFSMRYLLQNAVIWVFFVIFYYGLRWCILYFCSAWLAHLLLTTVALWVWVGPLWLCAVLSLYYSRHLVGITLHFLPGNGDS